MSLFLLLIQYEPDKKIAPVRLRALPALIEVRYFWKRTSTETEYLMRIGTKAKPQLHQANRASPSTGSGSASLVRVVAGYLRQIKRMLPVRRAARTARLPDRPRTSRRRMKQRVCRQNDPGTSPVDQVSVSDPYSESFTTTLCPARAKCASKPSTEVSGRKIRPAS